jgi:hypothetical protein
LAGETNIVYTLEASTDFASWFDLFSATNLDGILDLIDDTASNAPARLYRARE